jgi:hypothetical protein
LVANPTTPRLGVVHLEADHVLGDHVLIEVKRRFHKSSADRAVGQMSAYRQTWPDKPKLLVIFEADRREVFESTATPSLKALHRDAGTITVRM